MQKAAEAQAYIQYVAFMSATDRHVPVLLTIGNIMVLYIHNTRLNKHHRMYWGFGQIVDASIYLAELVKDIALNNPVMRGYAPKKDNHPESPEDPGTDHAGPDSDAAEHSMDHDERENDVKDIPMTKAVQDQNTSRTAGSIPLRPQHCWTEMQTCKKPCDLTDFTLASQLCNTMVFPHMPS